MSHPLLVKNANDCMIRSLIYVPFISVCRTLYVLSLYNVIYTERCRHIYVKAPLDPNQQTNIVKNAINVGGVLVTSRVLG